MTKITYTQSNVASRPTFWSKKFGNLLSDTYQTSVDQGSDGLWVAWFFNHSRKEIDFRLGFKSRSAAARWANGKLREVGVK